MDLEQKKPDEIKAADFSNDPEALTPEQQKKLEAMRERQKSLDSDEIGAESTDSSGEIVETNSKQELPVQELPVVVEGIRQSAVRQVNEGSADKALTGQTLENLLNGNPDQNIVFGGLSDPKSVDELAKKFLV